MSEVTVDQLRLQALVQRLLSYKHTTSTCTRSAEFVLVICSLFLDKKRSWCNVVYMEN